MKKPLLALLAVAALAVVAVAVVMENTPERRMDRRLDKLLRTHDEPEKLFQRVVDDRDLLGLLVVPALLVHKEAGPCHCVTLVFNANHGACEYSRYVTRLSDSWVGLATRLTRQFCDCQGTTEPVDPEGFSTEGPRPPPLRWDPDFHEGSCAFRQVFGDVQKRWGPYMEKKRQEFRDKAKPWLRNFYHEWDMLVRRQVQLLGAPRVLLGRPPPR